MNEQYEYIYQNKEWPKLLWDREKILSLLAEVKHAQGMLLGKISTLGLNVQETANLDTMTEEVIKSSAIEAEILNLKEVRSSIARKLGITIQDSVSSKRTVDGIVEMMIDATSNHDSPLTKERLFSWQAALFPTGYSGLIRITTGAFRDDKYGRMQVISSNLTGGKETVHFIAPEAQKLQFEMDRFLGWLNTPNNEDNIIKAGTAHLWFLILHPFDDGNGRIARAITEMLLARSDKNDKRFYSMSSQIQKAKNEYYVILEKIQKGSLDITLWLEWFLHCLLASIKTSEKSIESILKKYALIQSAADHKLNPRQRNIIDMLFDDFKGNLTSSKWALICKCSQDTANRDIEELIKLKILLKKGDGRSTHYILANSKL